MISGERSHCLEFRAAPSIFHISVRAKIRDEVDDYSASVDYWLRCLYEGEKGDPEDVEKGFLKSELLVKVHVSAAAPRTPRGSG